MFSFIFQLSRFLRYFSSIFFQFSLFFFRYFATIFFEAFTPAIFSSMPQPPAFFVFFAETSCSRVLRFRR